nr:CrcB family protein [uncultured Caproiciproducens sp.]
MNWILLCIGGACGAMARYKIGEILLKHSKDGFPLSALLINISGALLFGIICGLGFSGNPYLLFGDGFCGAFTTFSTFSVESVKLIKSGEIRKSVLFIGLSITFGLILFLGGHMAGKLFTDA